MKRTWFSILAAAVFCLFLSALVAAQEITGSISGTVRDSNGAGVPNATVTITNSDTKLAARTVITGSDGEFSAPTLPVAFYDVSVEATNFKKSITARVKLNVNERHTVDVTLDAGNVAETVTVNADPLQVNTQSAVASNVISGDQVRELSLNNRNWAQLITLSPGVSPNVADQIYVGSTNPGGQSNALQIAVNGVRSSSNTYTVDGADTTDRGANLTVQTYPSVDAIQEFAVLRSLYPAESGRSAGGQVNVVTKSGNSKFHGDVYEFWRNEKLNANPFLTNRTAPLGIDSNGKAKRPPLRYNNFGGTFGGPLVFPHFGEGGPMLEKGNTFFFFSEEVRRVIVYPSFTSTVPTAALRQGNFAQPVCTGPAANPCSVTATSIPQANWSPLAAAYVQDIYNKMPLPDANGNLFFPTRGVFNFRQDLIRIDHKFGDKVSAYYRFENDDIPTIDPNGTFGQGGGQPFIATAKTNSPGRTHVGRVTWVPTSSSVLEFGASYSFGDVPSQIIGLDNIANSPDIAAHLPTFAFPTTRGRIPTITGNGFSSVTAFGPYSDFSFNKSAFVTFSKIFGSHTTKYGANVSKIRKHENSLGGTNEGTYGAVTAAPKGCVLPSADPTCGKPSTTSNTNQLWANFLLGNTQTFTQNQFDLTADLHAASVEAFAQDEWRFKSNITLYYGLRFSRFGQPWDGNGRMTSFDPDFFNPSQAFQIGAFPSATSTANSNDGARIPGTGNPLNGIIVNSQASVPGATVSPWGKSVAPTRNNFAPRVGIAWDPFKKGTTSIRAGYGLYYDQLSFSFEETGLVATNPPFQQQIIVNPTTLDNPLGGSSSVSNAVQNVAGIDPNFKTPYVQSWSLDVQHQFGAKTLVTIGYFGSRGVHLTGLVDLNLLPPGYALTQTCVTNTATATTAPCQAPGQVFTSNAARTPANLNTSEILLNQIRPFRGYGAVRFLETAFDSNYHSLQVTAQHRFNDSSQVNLAYTWSKNLTNSQSESGSSPQNTYSFRDEWARASLDRRHILSVNYIYELPFFKDQANLTGKLLGGWQFSGITYVYTGLGFSAATSSNDPAGLGLLGSSPSGARPDQTCDPNSNAPNVFAQWFNTGCFSNPPAGVNRVGNASRNTIFGPSTTRFDATLSKNIRFGESKALQLRWEVFNIFNHTNFATLSSLNITSSAYGIIGTTRDPRTMQLGAKFSF
ncbi:MAG: carboxypeptidase regulatory-like domain-containing protein [Acidobacteriota bacterium]